MIDRAFAPHYGTNQVVVLAAATPQIKSIEGADTTVRVINAAAGDLYFRTYSSQQGNAPVADATCMKVLAGTERYVYADYTQDRISLYSLAGTTAEVMTGTGAV